MKRGARYSVKKTASELQNRDRFYLAGKKYCVTTDIMEAYLDRWTIITFVEVNGSMDTQCNLVVPPTMEFMILTGESGIGEKAYDAMQKEKS